MSTKETTVPNYLVNVVWSAEDREFVATCEELGDLSGLGTSRIEAVRELETAIAGWLDYLTSRGIPWPKPAATELELLVEMEEDSVFTLTEIKGSHRATSPPTTQLTQSPVSSSLANAPTRDVV